MTRVIWDTVGERYYETGVDRGVLYVGSNYGVPWNGLVSVTESPSGGESQPYYIDGFKYLNVPSSEEYAATIQAFCSPKEFDVCDGNVFIFNGLFVTNQPRKPFGLCYRTKLGNDIDGQDHGYRLHLIYNALAAPTQHSNSTLTDSTEPGALSWEITASPPSMLAYKPTAHLIIDSRLMHSVLLFKIEDILYGSAIIPSRLPLLAELVELFVNYVEFDVIDNGDGSYSAEGTGVETISDTVFAILHDSIVDNGDGTFTIL